MFLICAHLSSFEMERRTPVRPEAEWPWTPSPATAPTCCSSSRSRGFRACCVTACWWSKVSVSRLTRMSWQLSAHTLGAFTSFTVHLYSDTKTIHKTNLCVAKEKPQVNSMHQSFQVSIPKFTQSEERGLQLGHSGCQWHWTSVGLYVHLPPWNQPRQRSGTLGHCSVFAGSKHSEHVQCFPQALSSSSGNPLLFSSRHAHLGAWLPLRKRSASWRWPPLSPWSPEVWIQQWHGQQQKAASVCF